MSNAPHQRKPDMHALDEQTEIVFLDSTRTLFVHCTADLTVRNAVAVRDAVRSAWDDTPPTTEVLMDLGEVRHMDSSGVGALLELAYRARQRGVPLALSRLRESPRRLLDRTGLASLFRIHPTENTAFRPDPLEGEPRS